MAWCGGGGGGVNYSNWTSYPDSTAQTTRQICVRCADCRHRRRFNIMIEHDGCALCALCAFQRRTNGDTEHGHAYGTRASNKNSTHSVSRSRFHGAFSTFHGYPIQYGLHLHQSKTILLGARRPIAAQAGRRSPANTNHTRATCDTHPLFCGLAYAMHLAEHQQTHKTPGIKTRAFVRNSI